MYFYHQSLEKHFQHIHSYLPPNSCPNSASSRNYFQTPTSCTLQYLLRLIQINKLQRKRANSRSGCTWYTTEAEEVDSAVATEADSAMAEVDSVEATEADSATAEVDSAEATEVDSAMVTAVDLAAATA
jgi:hypothetical protein